MSEEEKQAIELLKEDIAYRESWEAEYNEEKYSNAERILINLVSRQQKEIEELNKVNKMIELYKSEAMPENTEMVLIHKKDFLRNFEVVSKDKIRALIEQLEDVLDLAESEKRFPKYRKQALIEEINDLQELLEE